MFYAHSRKRGTLAAAFGVLTALLMPVVMAATAGQAGSQGQPGYYRAPALGGDTLVFVAEGDLWRATATGGGAQRLTTHPAEELHPAVSPDGKRVAFSARYEGPMEIYVMPLTGGAPTRLTYDGGANARVQGWTADGKVLFSTTRFSGKPGPQLVTVDPASLERSTLPLADASEGCYLGGQFVFARRGLISDNVKRYKGGGAQSLWMVDMAASGAAREATPLTASYPGTSRQPMCAQNRVYFLSDRDGSMNLWSMTTQGRDLRQHTRHSGWDIKSASLSNGRIAYQLGADIRLLDIASAEDRIVPLQLVSDFDQLRTRWLKAPFEYLTDLALSPTGDRVALTARGQVFTTSVGTGRRAEITRASDVRARGVAFSHDGKSVYTFTDATGELEIWRYPANGVGAGDALTRGASTLRTGMVPSPDGKLIAHTVHGTGLFVLDVATGEDRQVTHGSKWPVGDLRWSPDSRWLSFALSAENSFSQLAVADVGGDVSTGSGTAPRGSPITKVTRVTSDRYDASSPTFSSDGKFLYFIAERNLQTLVPNPWGSRNTGPFFDRRGKIYGLALTADARWPFLPKDELTPASSTSAAAPAAVASASVVTATPSGSTTTTTTVTVAPAPATAPPATSSPANIKAVNIVFERLATRLYEVPLAAGNHRQLATDGKRLYFVSTDTSVERKATLRTLAIEPVASTPPQPDVFFDDVRSYQLSQDQKKVLLRRANDVWVVDAGAKAPTDLSKSVVNLRDWTIRADPRDEWKQMFVDAWRMHRDMFWDANMHGADWPAVRRKYEPLLSRVTDRSELNNLIAQMTSEAVALHSQVGAADLRRGGEDVGIAALGASFSKQANGFRVEKIFSGDPELIEERSPLARAEVNMAVGDVITQVNGVAMDSPIALSLALRQQAGVQVLLRVQSAATGIASTPGVRDVVVTPVTAQRDADLRYLDWEQSRAAVVETAGRGKLAYVHLQSMGPRDIARFVREFFPAINREGLILDLRDNEGGNIDSWVIDRLQRKAWHFWQTRRSDAVYGNQQDSFRGHVVALIDGDTYSDGETIAEGLKRLGIATLIGMRTAGAGIWLSDRNRLRDNGIARAAESGSFVSTPTENRWIIEGVGVTPDITVDNLPVATFNGGDAQLDAAIGFLQDKLKREPIVPPRVPPMPVRAKQ